MGELNIDKMAARRVTATAVDWAKYAALKIPYPQDTYTSSIDAEASSLKVDYAKFVDESKKRIVGIQQEQAKWEAMMPVEEMNLEECLDAGLTQYVVDVN